MPFINEDWERELLTNAYENDKPEINDVEVVNGINKAFNDELSGKEEISSDEQLYKASSVPSATGSRINPLYQFKPADGIIMNEHYANKQGKGEADVSAGNLEPTIANLLDSQKTQGKVGLLYDPADFMYCRDAEACSGYHMITLRRFPAPVRDNLIDDSSNQKIMDMCRLVTYSTDEQNKFSDIMNMSFGLKWRELTANFWTPDIIGAESGSTGILGALYKIMNPRFSAGDNAKNVNPHYDENKTYGPVDSITSTHIRDRGINFSHDINLTFDYELRAYDGVDPKAAFIDLLANILVMSTNDANFWPGAILWRGVSRSYHQNYISANEGNLLSHDFNEVKKFYSNRIRAITGGGSVVEQLVTLGKALLNYVGVQCINKIIDTLGRPTVAVANSLLSSEPVGLWHLTVGNPFRPILAIGDLILTNTQLSFGDKLGVDGFPTTMKVTVSLKHNKPRDRAGIETMFNNGTQRIYWQPKNSTLQKQTRRSYAYKSKSADVLSYLSGEIYRYSQKSSYSKNGNTKTVTIER